jgi:hypothetical protein
MAQTPDDSPVTSHWPSCRTQLLHHDAITDSGPSLFWEVLDRFLQWCSYVPGILCDKMLDKFLLIRLHSTYIRGKVESPKMYQKKMTVMMLNWVTSYPDGFLSGQSGGLLLQHSIISPRDWDRQSSIPWSLFITPRKALWKKKVNILNQYLFYKCFKSTLII